MRLDQQLADFKAEFLRTAPAGRPALYEAKIEELRAGFALEAAVGVEARAPDFRLPDVRGNNPAPMLAICTTQLAEVSSNRLITAGSVARVMRPISLVP